MFLEFFKKRIKIYGAIALSVVIFLVVQSYSSNADAQNQVIKVAQSKSVASLNVRISALEEQVRVLRGQVDGLQFQLTQMQPFLERQQEDYEFRFQQLEGGAPKKTNADPLLNSDMLVKEEPQNIDISASGLELVTPGVPLGSQTQELGFKPEKLVTIEDADAQYRAGYDAIIRADNDFAQEQFKQFIDLFPTHPQAPDATNWLGEILLNKGDYHEAAQVLLNGFQSYSASSRAPDLLLKLGMALAGAKEKETACRTFAQVPTRYPNLSSALKKKLNEEVKKAKC